MPRCRVDLTITIETALSVGGSGTVGTLADKSLLRDGWGRLVLPGSQVRGRVRHTCEALARGLGHPICRPPNPETMCPNYDDRALPRPIPRTDAGHPQCIICAIFGSPGYRSRLRFGDLLYDPFPEDREAGLRYQGELETLRPGVGIDRHRRSVKDELLFFLETSAPGSHPRFTNPHAIVGELERPEAGLLAAALQQTDRWGGAKSRGLGWAQVDYTFYLDDGVWTVDWQELQQL